MQVSSINELRLDANAVCETNQAHYRARMIQNFPALRHLDLRALSDADRQEAIQFLAPPPAAPTQECNEVEQVFRTHAISCVKSMWSKREGQFGPAKGSTRHLHVHDPASEPASTASLAFEERDTKSSAREDAVVHRNNTGFSEIEVHGDFRVLVMYGNALDALESAKARAVVNAVTFRYIDVERLSTETICASLKLFSRLRRITFSHNDLSCFSQLTWLAALASKAEEVRCCMKKSAESARRWTDPGPVVTLGIHLAQLGVRQELAQAIRRSETQCLCTCVSPVLVASARLTRAYVPECRAPERRGDLVRRAPSGQAALPQAYQAAGAGSPERAASSNVCQGEGQGQSEAPARARRLHRGNGIGQHCRGHHNGVGNRSQAHGAFRRLDVEDASTTHGLGLSGAGPQLARLLGQHRTGATRISSLDSSVPRLTCFGGSAGDAARPGEAGQRTHEQPRWTLAFVLRVCL